MGFGVEQPPPRRYTISEYLAFEREAKEKHEYRDGQIIAMAGGTYNHGLIAANSLRIVGNALIGKPCRAVDSTVRVGVPRSALYTYPDITVVCGEAQFDSHDSRGETLTNPRVIVEILSPSTEGYDRGDKFSRYRRLESLEEYVLVSQDSPNVETFFRQNDGGWQFMAFSGLEAMARIRCLAIELPLKEIYAGVKFPPPPPEPQP
jgi:Uma2 family endonuclease